MSRALYTDWKNVYTRQPTAAEEAAGEENVFCLEHVRKVGNDFVVQFGKRALQLMVRRGVEIRPARR